MTQSFGFFERLISSSLAFAVPAAIAATAPKQVVNSTLRITNPPTFFWVLSDAVGPERAARRHRPLQWDVSPAACHSYGEVRHLTSPWASPKLPKTFGDPSQPKSN